MNEKIKRLQPLKHVLRELYLKSGNECAFPECEKRMIATNGDFIGQLCHIEAAEEGGQRFNKNQSNEQRRHFENLLLMCYEHHVATNDVATYDVVAMKKIKTTHESRFSHVAAKIQESIEVDTDKEIPVLVSTKMDAGTQKHSRSLNLKARLSYPALVTFDFRCTYGGSARSKILNHTTIFKKIEPTLFSTGDTVQLVAELTPYDDQYLFSNEIVEPLKIECITLKGKKVIVVLDFDGYKVEQRL